MILAMLPKEISSLQHPIVKKAVSIRENGSVRRETGLVLVSGKKLIAELAAQMPLTALFLMPGELPPKEWAIETLYWMHEALFKKVTGLIHPEPIAALVPLPKPANLHPKKWLLGLDGINDPGNLGTLLRTASALGWEGVFLIDGCADPFNEKALRASKGACFYLPLAFGSKETLLEISQAQKLKTWVADIKGTPLNQAAPLEAGLLILGNEANGVCPWLKEQFPKITIPLTETMESLNVASAGAILMYGLKHAKR